MAGKIIARAAALAVPLAAVAGFAAPAAHADAAPAPVPPKGEHCGVTTTEQGFSAGVQELTTGTLDCAVKGAKDVLTGASDLLNQDKDADKH